MNQQQFNLVFEGLPPRRKQVLVKLLAGETDEAIARYLHIAESTVRKHIQKIHLAFELKNDFPDDRRSKRRDLFLLFVKHKPELVWETDTAEKTETTLETVALAKNEAVNAGSNGDGKGQVNGEHLFDFIATEHKGSGQEPKRLNGENPISFVGSVLPNVSVTSEVDEKTVPYQGLKAFGKEQAQFFFGREKDIPKLVEKLKQANFIPLIGASGSGKSSVVRAGLIPQLEKNGWRILETILPGVEPLAELKRAFAQLFERTEVRQIYSLINADGLSPVIERLSSSERLLLVVDQFEEVFTVCSNEEDRLRFIELLTQVAEMPARQLAIVITMRVDFLEPCLSYPSLTQLIQNHAVYLPLLTGADLERAIASPASLQGYQLETGLLGAILDDVGKDKGCLPLLQFALTELWEQRDRQTHQLMLAKYMELGGVIGALNRHAEQLYQSFTEQQQDWAKRIFLKLVRTGAEGKDTRQRQTKLKLLTSISDDPFELQAINDVLLDQLVQGRLLVTGQEPEGESWVDLAHEALMEGWERFVIWREEGRELRRLTDRIEDALREWQKNPQDENLMMGGLLAQMQKRWSELAPNLDPSAREFCQRSEALEQERREQAEMAKAKIHNALEKEKELSELKSQFVLIASYEFRNPLTTILSSTELLEQYSHNWSEEKKQRHFQRIKTSIHHLTQLVNDVLLIGSTERGKLEFEPSPLDLVTFCRNLVEDIPISASSHHKLNFVTLRDCTDANMDEKLLKLIITNLLSNAIKYSPQGGIVQFDLVCNQESAVFRIQDNGIGIPPEDLEHLFESFHRASNVGTIPGTGLGLAIVKKCVDLHQGEILIESEVGVGTTCIVTLPLKYATQVL